MKTILKIIMASALVLALTVNAFAQINTNLQFTAVAVTDEHAIRLTWASTNSELYEIDEADALNDTNTGSITWNKLYDNYPSQGTNTFIGDFGNYHLTPAIVHPKNSPMRFYRVVDEGADGLASDEPIVSISSPTNSAIASGELIITVTAATDQPVISGTKLYVDGQEMQMAITSTNYIDGSTNYEVDTYAINTCEWGNGTHTLFATTKNASGFGNAINSPTVFTGQAVSAFVPVTFNNLISRISFSQPFFNPDAGQTQQVSAVFANNSDWTLNIVDVSSNVVFTTTGSGSSMQYNWDGNGNGGTNLPTGIYYYYISAQTNGESSDFVSGNSSSLARSSAIRSEPPELWAVAPNSENVVPLAIYPQGFDTNGFTIFSATPSEVESLITSSSSESTIVLDNGDGFSSDTSSGGSSSQDSPTSPQRPPNNSTKGVAGKFGLAYQDYSPVLLSLATPLNGFPVLPGQKAQHVQLEDSSGITATCPYLESVSIDNFVTQMARGTWQSGLTEANTQLKAADLKGSGSPFNQFPLGMISLHGAYGSSPDFNLGPQTCEQVYFPIDGRPNTSSWVGLADMNFGASGTNGLKWMALLCCNSLRQDNWNSMQSVGLKPFNNNLHLMLGANSIDDDGNLIIWAKKMLGLDGQPRETIYNAWKDSAPFCIHRPVQFAIVGFDDCKQDMLTGTNSNTPQGSIFYDLQPIAP